MVMGIALKNGRDKNILDTNIQPYVIHSVETITLGTRTGLPSGVKRGSVTLPTNAALVFAPWNATVQGGAVNYINGMAAEILFYTSAATAKVVIATPFRQSSFQLYSDAVGLAMRNEDNLLIYDSRKPLLQLVNRHMVVGAARGSTQTVDTTGANYVHQCTTDIGVVDWIFASGALRRSSNSSATMAINFTENAGDWGDDAIRNMSSASRHHALFAAISVV